MGRKGTGNLEGQSRLTLHTNVKLGFNVLKNDVSVQPELREVLFPVFVHTFLDLIETARKAGKCRAIIVTADLPNDSWPRYRIAQKHCESPVSLRGRILRQPISHFDLIDRTTSCKRIGCSGTCQFARARFA
jgi:hypothetical protein